MRPTKADLDRALARAKLEVHAAALAPYARLELALVHDRAGDPTAIGASRIGGAPDLPPGCPWPDRRWPLADVPTWQDWARAEVDRARACGQAKVEGDELVMPLPFLVQVDLATVGDDRLPDRGVLAFFAAVTSDIDDPRYAKRVAARVIYSPDRSVLVPREPPPTYDQGAAHAIALRVEHDVRWDLPDDWEELAKAFTARELEAFAIETGRVGHALFPCPHDELVGSMPPAGQVALARIEDDDASEFRVGDASWVTFAIPDRDLVARRFDAACASVFIG